MPLNLILLHTIKGHAVFDISYILSIHLVINKKTRVWKTKPFHYMFCLLQRITRVYNAG